jgi:hypothetical protein
MFFPENIGKYWFSMAFVPFLYNFRESPGGGAGVVTGPVSGSIMFPIPASLVDNTNVTYSDFNVISEGIAVATSVLGELAKIVGNFGPVSKFTSTGFAASLGALSKAGSYGFKLGQLSYGTAVNPGTTLLLQGPSLKEHTFTWRFSPDSERGSRHLNAIINRIKRDMSPTFAGAFGGAMGLSLGYPKMVKCAFYNREQLYSFKPAMITGFSVNYAPSNSPAFFNSTYPAEVELKITIKEVEAWLAEDYTQGSSTNPSGFATPFQRS